MNGWLQRASLTIGYYAALAAVALGVGGLTWLWCFGMIYTHDPTIRWSNPMTAAKVTGVLCFLVGVGMGAASPPRGVSGLLSPLVLGFFSVLLPCYKGWNFILADNPQRHQLGPFELVIIVVFVGVAMGAGGFLGRTLGLATEDRARRPEASGPRTSSTLENENMTIGSG